MAPSARCLFRPHGDPSDSAIAQVAKALKIKRKECASFLTLVRLRDGIPPRPFVDQLNISAIQASFPNLSFEAAQQCYETALGVIERTMAGGLGDAWPANVLHPPNDDDALRQQIEQKTLTKAQCRALFPANTGAITTLLRKLTDAERNTPTPPTRPDNGRTSLSINDFMSYSDLPKEDIRSQVFGHRHPMKNIKRQYVFNVAYGQYDADVVELQDRLRSVQEEVQRLRGLAATFDDLVRGTRWANRAAIDDARRDAQRNLSKLEKQSRATGANSRSDPAARRVRSKLRRLENQIETLTSSIERDTQSVEDLQALEGQLNTQVARLTRAIVSRQQLYTLHFVVSPRCGTSIEERELPEPGACKLCHQTPEPTYTEADLIEEQSRIAAQVTETTGLIALRLTRLDAGKLRVRELEHRCQETSRELNFRLHSFVSNAAAELQDMAAQRAHLQATIQQSGDALALFQRRDEAGRQHGSLIDEPMALESQVEAALARVRMSRQRSSG